MTNIILKDIFIFLSLLKKRMLSKASKYAIKAVLHLTNTASEKSKKGAKQIAKELNIPAPFLAKTLQELTKKGIISSIKGPHGGFYLSEENEKNTLYNVIDCVGDIHKFDLCYIGELECNSKNPCVVHHLYAPFKKELLKKLKKKTILEMATEFTNNNLSQIV